MTLTFEIGNPYYDFTRYSCYIGVGVPTFEVMHPIALAKKKTQEECSRIFFFVVHYVSMFRQVFAYQ